MSAPASALFALLLLSPVWVGLGPELAQAKPRQPNPPGLCPADLPTALDTLANQPALQRGQVGVLVQTLVTASAPITLYSRNPEKYFIPASNTKLFTTAAALQRLGAQAQIQTEFYGEGSGPNLRRLVVVGKGDPGLSTAQLTTVARQLAQQGIRQIDALVGDDSYFRGDRFNPTWEWEDTQAGYGTQVNSLILDENAFGLTLTPQALGQPLQVSFVNPQLTANWQIINQTRTIAPGETEYVAVSRNEATRQLVVSAQLLAGSAPETTTVAVPNPGEHFLARFQQILATQQIQVRQTQVSQQPVPRAGTIVATLTSAPLASLITEVNRFSNNLYAESLLRWLGSSTGNRESDHAAAGLKLLPTLLTPLGVDARGYRLSDGSGLSRRNLISPLALVQLLQGMAQSPLAASYRASLTVAATNGTLKARFQNTPVAGQLQGKTGTLTDALALSGYLTPSQHPPLVFSILINQTGQPTEVLRPIIDQIVITLASLKRCE
jgi:serine-type D-Ala-D-Ala carboxypeptidase/endopeptidase (penicillin-binding protein 4)